MSERIKKTQTFDGKAVEVWLNADGTAHVTSAHGFGWTAKHIDLSPPDALLVATEATLFDASEMPHLIRAAKRLADRGKTVLPGDLRREASLASHRTGTRPADVARPAPKRPSKTFLESYSKRGGSLVEHVKRGCRRIHCSVCG